MCNQIYQGNTERKDSGILSQTHSATLKGIFAYWCGAGDVGHSKIVHFLFKVKYDTVVINMVNASE